MTIAVRDFYPSLSRVAYDMASPVRSASPESDMIALTCMLHILYLEHLSPPDGGLLSYGNFWKTKLNAYEVLRNANDSLLRQAFADISMSDIEEKITMPALLFVSRHPGVEPLATLFAAHLINSGNFDTPDDIERYQKFVYGKIMPFVAFDGSLLDEGLEVTFVKGGREDYCVRTLNYVFQKLVSTPTANFSTHLSHMQYLLCALVDSAYAEKPRLDTPAERADFVFMLLRNLARYALPLSPYRKVGLSVFNVLAMAHQNMMMGPRNSAALAQLDTRLYPPQRDAVVGMSVLINLLIDYKTPMYDTLEDGGKSERKLCAWLRAIESRTLNGVDVRSLASVESLRVALEADDPETKDETETSDDGTGGADMSNTKADGGEEPDPESDPTSTDNPDGVDSGTPAGGSPAFNDDTGMPGVDNSNNMEIIPLDREGASTNALLYRMAVAKLDKALCSNPDAPVSQAARERLHAWCCSFLFIASLDATKTLINELGLAKAAGLSLFAEKENRL